MKKGFPNPWLELQALLFNSPRHQPARPGFVRKLAKRNGSFFELLFDNSRYPGRVLREIRAGREINGHSNARERNRRLARGCCQ